MFCLGLKSRPYCILNSFLLEALKPALPHPPGVAFKAIWDIAWEQPWGIPPQLVLPPGKTQIAGQERKKELGCSELFHEPGNPLVSFGGHQKSQGDKC